MPLQDIVAILKKGKWIILGTLLVVLGAVAVYTFVKTPEYEATSLLHVSNQQSTPQLNELLGLEVVSRNVHNEVEIIKSRSSATRVARRLLAEEGGTASEPVFTVLRPEEEGLSLEEVVRRLREDYITVRPVSRDVDLIAITAVSTVPEEARHLANLYAEAYRDHNRASSRSRMTGEREFFDGITARFSEQLQQAEDDLSAFLAQEQIAEPDEEARQLLQQTSELQALKHQSQLQLGTAQAELRGLERELDQATPGLASQISSSDDLMVDRLKEQIAELQIEQEQIFARNPGLRGQASSNSRLAQIERELDELTQQLSARATHLVASAVKTGALPFGTVAGTSSRTADRLQAVLQLRRQVMEKEIEVSGLQARLGIAEEELARYKARLAEIPQKALVLQRLQRTHQAQEQIYLTLLEKVQEARIAEQSELGFVEVVDEAELPERPARPHTLLNLALGLLLGLLSGVGLAFARHAFDTKIRDPEDLRRYGLYVAGVVPNMARAPQEEHEGRERTPLNGHALSARLITALDPSSPVSEAYRHIQTNVFGRSGARVRSVLVTSTGPGEGKSVTALNLALIAAQSGWKTLFIDADLRRARAARMLDVPREPGLSDVLGEPDVGPMDRFRTDLDDLYVIPAGRKIPNPTKALGSEQMGRLLERLHAEFDAIFIDTPPALVVADPLLLADQCDATLLVAMAGQTDSRALERTLEVLGMAGARVAGAVLNRFEADAAYSAYSYGYTYSYRYDYDQADAA